MNPLAKLWLWTWRVTTPKINKFLDTRVGRKVEAIVLKIAGKGGSL